MKSYIRLSDEGDILEVINQRGLGIELYAGLLEVELPEDLVGDPTGWSYIDDVFSYIPVALISMSQADQIKKLQSELALIKAALNI